MKRILALTASGIAMVAMATPAHAVDTYDDLAAWQAAVGTYNRDTAYGDVFASISDLTLDDGTAMTFGSAMSVRQIGSGWATWSGGYTGQVLYTNGLSSISSTLSPVGAFGLFVESNPFGLYTFTLGLSDGSSVQGTYEGASGAGFLGFVGAGITSFTLSSDVDFAFGDFYTADATGAVPEPGTWLMLLLGFGAIGFGMRSRKARHNVAVSYA
jgi:hypothetical protein